MDQESLRADAWIQFAGHALSRADVSAVDAAVYADKMLIEFDKRWAKQTTRDGHYWIERQRDRRD